MTGYDPRAAVSEALAAGIGLRKSGVAPPERRDAAPPEGNDTAPLERSDAAAVRALPLPGPRRARPAIGTKRGQRRVLDLNLSRSARSVLATHGEQTRGSVIVSAVEATYKTILDDYAVVRRTGLFAETAPSAQRRIVDDPRKVIATLTEDEAAVLGDVVARTVLSVSAFVDEALTRWR